MRGVRLEQAALAFEAGEAPEPFGHILDTLDRLGTRSTIFLDGLWAEQHPDLVVRATRDGHELGNHGYGHPDWRTLTDDEVRADLRHVEEIVTGLTGHPPGPWALPPLMGVDDRVKKVLRDAGYRDINRYPVDGNAYQDRSPEGIRRRAVEEARSGEVVIIHTGRWPSAEAVPGIVSDLREAGVVVARVSDLEVVPDYPPVTPPQPSGK